MAVNEVILNGETLVSLVNDTVTADKLLDGVTAHNAEGEPIEGNAVIPTRTSQLTNDSGFVSRKSGVPYNVKAIPQNGAILLTWDIVSGADKYRIQRQSGSTWSTFATITTTSYLHTGLTNGTTYVYRVLASADGGTTWGGASDAASATPLINLLNSGTAAASTTNCPVGCWYGQYS